MKKPEQPKYNCSFLYIQTATVLSKQGILDGKSKQINEERRLKGTIGEGRLRIKWMSSGRRRRGGEGGV